MNLLFGLQMVGYLIIGFSTMYWVWLVLSQVYCTLHIQNNSYILNKLLVHSSTYSNLQVITHSLELHWRIAKGAAVLNLNLWWRVLFRTLLLAEEGCSNYQRSTNEGYWLKAINGYMTIMISMGTVLKKSRFDWIGASITTNVLISDSNQSWIPFCIEIQLMIIVNATHSFLSDTDMQYHHVHIHSCNKQ